MHKLATLRQGFSLLSVLANNTNWECLDRDLLQHLINQPSETGAQFTMFLRIQNGLSAAETAPVPVSEVFTEQALVINFNLTLDAMIAAGHYDWVNKNITIKRLPVEGKGTVQCDAKLFHFNRSISSEIAVRRIESADSINTWEPGRIEHLLAFGAKYPNEQHEHPIVALGTIGDLDDHRIVSLLHRTGTKRHLRLDCLGGDWSSFYRFLAVRKTPNSSLSRDITR
jgi:hypothetical protein